MYFFYHQLSVNYMNTAKNIKILLNPKDSF